MWMTCLLIVSMTLPCPLPAAPMDEKLKARLTRFCSNPRRSKLRVCKLISEGDGEIRTSPVVLDQKAYKDIKDVCVKRNCSIDNKDAEPARESVITLAQSVLGNERAEELAVMNYAAKSALYNRDGLLEFITPIDNGLFGGVLLSETYAEREIEALQNDNGAVQDSPPAPNRLVKRNAMYFGQGSNWTDAMWNSLKPIDYFIDTGFASDQIAIIEKNILDIGEKTCISFRRLSSPPSTEHIRFIPASSPAFCGLSIIGKIKPYNPIWLNFGSSACAPLMKGTPSHEILHTLGLSHAHQRPDRDKFIKVEWSNIDPQYYDYYATTSYNAGYSTYGIPYDYLSVTHYGTNVHLTSISYFPDSGIIDEQANNDSFSQRRLLQQGDGSARSAIIL